jgi:hypothetical protein
MSGPGMHMREKQAERFAAYRKLRDDGVNAVDAGHEIGVSLNVQQAYERAYRDLLGLPRRGSLTTWSGP